MDVWSYFLTVNSIPSIYVTILVPAPLTFGYFSLVRVWSPGEWILHHFLEREEGANLTICDLFHSPTFMVSLYMFTSKAVGILIKIALNISVSLDSIAVWILS